MFFNNYYKNKCSYGCVLYNYSKNYIYWENRNPTNDEVEILDYLRNNFSNQNLNILHIGIGSSFIANNLKNISKIDGITISQNEILNANKLNIQNYRTFLINKHQKDFLELILSKFNSKYDLIIDVNLKSFSCCQLSFEKVINNYSKLLNKNGLILSGTDGMNWTGTLKPVFRFSIKKLFYKKLKEFPGPKNNVLTIKECIDLADKNDLIFRKIKNSNIVSFTKS